MPLDRYTPEIAVNGVHHPGAAPGVVPALLDRIARGDRAAVAEFASAFGGQLRSRFRARLGSGPLQFGDSEDFLSTVRRRLDSVLCTGSYVPDSVLDLRSLLFQLAEEAMAEIDRTEQLHQHAHSKLVPVHALSTKESDQRADTEIELRRLSPDEQELLRLRASGQSNSRIAQELNLSAAAVRMRWCRLVKRLRSEENAA